MDAGLAWRRTCGIICVALAIALGSVTHAAAQFQPSIGDEDDEILRELEELGFEPEDGDRRAGTGDNGFSTLPRIPFVTVPFPDWLLAQIPFGDTRIRPRLDFSSWFIPKLTLFEPSSFWQLPKWPDFGAAIADTLVYGYGSKLTYFAGGDVWRAGFTAYGGVFYSASGGNAGGFIAKALFAEGAYVYRLGRRPIRGVYVLASIMPGWRISTPALDIKTYAGIDLQSHRLLPDDRRNRMRGGHAGGRAGIDVWWQPQPWAMVTSSVSASTIGGSYHARIATGVRIPGWFWIGPEAEFGHNDAYRQHRFGAHITGFQYSWLNLTLSAGVLSDSDNRSGIYVRGGIAAQLLPDYQRFSPF
ncbi:MAG: cellulose biosynthesis protein BcsS [Pseudomonadota bacterium]